MANSSKITRAVSYNFTSTSSFDSADLKTKLIDPPVEKIRTIDLLRLFILSLKNYGVDGLFDYDNGKTTAFSETMTMLRTAVSTRVFRKITNHVGDRVFQAWKDYPDSDHVSIKKKAVKLCPSWGRFSYQWPIDIVLSRMINNKKQAVADKTKAKATPKDADVMEGVKRKSQSRKSAKNETRKLELRKAQQLEAKAAEKQLAREEWVKAQASSSKPSDEGLFLGQ